MNERESVEWCRSQVQVLQDASEQDVVDMLLQMQVNDSAPLLHYEHCEKAAQEQALHWMEAIRANQSSIHAFDKFIQEYSLSSQEGLALMSLAEALHRTPDSKTAESLIADKLRSGDWSRHLGNSESLLVNASTFGLVFVGEFVQKNETLAEVSGYTNLFKRMGEKIAARAIKRAINLMGDHFVLGQTMKKAIDNASMGSRFSSYAFDVLGEGARTRTDATRNFQAYTEALAAIIVHQNQEVPYSLSIKLSALHPRYESTQAERITTELVPQLLELALHARENGVQISIDAEESERLELTMDIYQELVERMNCESTGVEAGLGEIHTLGFVVQAYQKRAVAVIDWLVALAKRENVILPVRLVKGAYWDAEIKRAQKLNTDGYPVFTRKSYTDFCYEMCVLKMLSQTEFLYPQVATHNARAAAFALAVANHENLSLSPDRYELQRLYGMGELLYKQIFSEFPDVRNRIYAPVGTHRELLPYLLRRLLENGANNSFVHQLYDEEFPIAELSRSPIWDCRKHNGKPHAAIPLPSQIYCQPEKSVIRKRAKGWDLQSSRDLRSFIAKLDYARDHLRQNKSEPVNTHETSFKIVSPASPEITLGHHRLMSEQDILQALEDAREGYPDWSGRPVDERARCLENLAKLLEQSTGEISYLIAYEGGRTLTDVIDEMREAVEFCYYYAYLARNQLSEPISTLGPTGELNQLYLVGRGVYLCISPWNFPLAIFIGQIVAALVSGNTVLAKPAEQTTLIAQYVEKLFYKAGFPDSTFHLILATGTMVSDCLLDDERISGVAFTGSNRTALMINQKLASRKSIVPFIAETGGQNVMVVDSSALLEQVTDDLIRSSFKSAGQRCSSVRVAYIQDDIFESLIAMVSGACDELCIGLPWLATTDIGPIIDKRALDSLSRHCLEMEGKAKQLYKYRVDMMPDKGYFFPPQIFEIESISELEEEVFGPVLHVVRWKSGGLDNVINEINSTGYGLTFGVHSRITSTAEYLCRGVRAGNCYINRDTIGAFVGTTPFGGQGLSGTGPKAGGPHYLSPFVTEKTITNNITALGGNVALLNLDHRP